jgi:DNA primase
MNYRLLVLLEKVLGKGKITSGTNVAFFSPFCNHNKRKLEVNLQTVNGKNPWHCWITDEKGKTIYSLFKKLKLDKKFYLELENCVETIYTSHQNKNDNTLQLPDEFKPLSKLIKSDLKIPEIKHALVYLNKRNITSNDIKRYNIGICLSGEYKNRIIIPSYNQVGELNYFVSRTFFDNNNFKYKNPKVSKDIIPFEMYVNWNLPVYLVEGVFDAIAVKFNAIPLLGKTLQSSIKKKIIEEKPPAVYVALDLDAKRDAIKIIKTIHGIGVPVFYVNLKDKDPSELGHEKFFSNIKDSIKCSTEKIMRMEFTV